MEKRVLTIQDFSCLGRCSLTVAIPTLSAAGLETVALPTAILSNHTDFSSWTYLDLTNQMFPIIDKWKDYRHSFDFIYTGYLSTNQIEIVIEIIKRLKDEKTMIVVDPAMADHGKLYPGFEEKHVEEMKKLISCADIIIPNLTEACLLANILYPGSEKGTPLDFYKKVIHALSKLGPKKIIISGQELKEGEISDIVYDGEKISLVTTSCHPGAFHGTGDLFASSFVGALGANKDYLSSVKIAHDYVHEAIRITNENHLDGLLYGPDFESALPFYIKSLGLSK